MTEYSSFMKPVPHTLTLLIILSLFFSLSAVAKDKGVELVVTDPFAEMHTGPGRGFPVFHVIEKGETIRVYKARADWFKVETLGAKSNATDSNATDSNAKKSDSKGTRKTGWIYRDELASTLGINGETVDLSPPGREAFANRRWEWGFGGGNFSGARSLNTYVGAYLTRNISAELRFTESFGSFSNSKMAAVNLVHQPFPDWKVSPFFTLGTGAILISPSSDIVQPEDRENGVMTVGGGLIFYASRSYLIRLEYNDHTLLTEREFNEEVDEWKAGFSVFF